MPVTASNERMEVDTDDNIEEASTSNAAPGSTNPPATGSKSSSQSTATAASSNVMANPSVVPSVTVSLHPLVIMNISEHWTRIRAQGGMPAQGKMTERQLRKLQFI